MTTLLAAALATLVFCAPGYPGGAGDAQPLVNDFATAAAAAAGWPAGSLAAVYDPTEEGGLQKLNSADAVLAFVPYPFFVEHAAQLHLTPLVQADVADTGVQQRWTLVAKAGRVTAPASMAGFTIQPTLKSSRQGKYSAPCEELPPANRLRFCSIRRRRPRSPAYRSQLSSRRWRNLPNCRSPSLW
jgi:hypothetical protein